MIILNVLNILSDYFSGSVDEGYDAVDFDSLGDDNITYSIRFFPSDRSWDITQYRNNEPSSDDDLDFNFSDVMASKGGDVLGVSYDDLMAMSDKDASDTIIDLFDKNF